MNKSIMFPGVGVYANIDHVCVETTFLKFQTAILLFRKFGYELDKRSQEEFCGLSVTMVKEGCVSIQLRETTTPLLVLSSENHIGILVDDPERAWQGIKKWADENGISAEMEEVSKGTMYVSIPEVVIQVIDLVPNPNSCPECHAWGTILLGCDGQTFETTCFSCDGEKYIKK